MAFWETGKPCTFTNLNSWQHCVLLLILVSVDFLYIASSNITVLMGNTIPVRKQYVFTYFWPLLCRLPVWREVFTCKHTSSKEIMVNSHLFRKTRSCEFMADWGRPYQWQGRVLCKELHTKHIVSNNKHYSSKEKQSQIWILLCKNTPEEAAILWLLSHILIQGQWH